MEKNHGELGSNHWEISPFFHIFPHVFTKSYVIPDASSMVLDASSMVLDASSMVIDASSMVLDVTRFL